jgi:hypothetical protein
MALRTCARLFLIIAVTWTAAALSCEVDCPSGYRGVCVRISQKCYCSCAKDVSGGRATLTGLLKKNGVNQKAIEDALSELSNYWDKGGTYSVTDEKLGSISVEVLTESPKTPNVV